MLKNSLKKIFLFTSGERNGVIILLIILLIILVIRFLMPVFNGIIEARELKKFEKERDKFISMLEKIDTVDNKLDNNEIIDAKSLHFKTKIFHKLKIEINKADTNELRKLPGIGIVYSRRIVKYRNLLGGFYSKNQLKEVYGISDELVYKISSDITIDTTIIKKLDISNDDFKKINAHPYISFDQTKAIFNLRFKTKKNIKEETLIESGIFTANDFNKIKPYNFNFQ